ncbi:MAG: 1-phosphofructokinase [Ruminococcus sp.]|nr:1-phosphofructokinase [Ruminococcus sp.]
MIYTVTFNPAIDYVVHTGGLALGSVNRSQSEEMYFGGKGINVSMILAELGVRSIALGFVAGFTGEAIEQGVRSKGIETDFVRLPDGNSRINVKIKSGEETEINGQGPDIGPEAIEKLYARLDKLTEGDTLILAGSVPSSMPSDIYERIIGKYSGNGVRMVVDASKDLLLKVLRFHPYLIKPNDFELSEMFGVELSSDADIIKYAGELRKMGACNVIVSMAGNGSLLLDSEGNVHRYGVCRGTVRNSVGAGDSMLAGFLAGSVDGDLDYGMKLGTACGGATAFSEGLADRAMIDEMLAQLG